jgi:hypothetical protein
MRSCQGLLFVKLSTTHHVDHNHHPAHLPNQAHVNPKDQADVNPKDHSITVKTPSHSKKAFGQHTRKAIIPASPRTINGKQHCT